MLARRKALEQKAEQVNRHKMAQAEKKRKELAKKKEMEEARRMKELDAKLKQ